MPTGTADIRLDWLIAIIKLVHRQKAVVPTELRFLDLQIQTAVDIGAVTLLRTSALLANYDTCPQPLFAA